MKALLFACSVLCAASSYAQQAPQVFVSIPCRLAEEEIPFVCDADHQAIDGYVVSMATLKKTGTRASFKDLTAKERKRLQKQARRMHACEIIVINDYQRPPGSKLVDAEMEARMQQEIQFYMVQGRRPCPECPTASN